MKILNDTLCSPQGEVRQKLIWREATLSPAFLGNSRGKFRARRLKARNIFSDKEGNISWYLKKITMIGRIERELEKKGTRTRNRHAHIHTPASTHTSRSRQSGSNADWRPTDRPDGAWNRGAHMLKYASRRSHIPKAERVQLVMQPASPRLTLIIFLF